MNFNKNFLIGKPPDGRICERRITVGCNRLSKWPIAISSYNFHGFPASASPAQRQAEPDCIKVVGSCKRFEIVLEACKVSYQTASTKQPRMHPQYWEIQKMCSPGSLNQVFHFSTSANLMAGPTLKEFSESVGSRHLTP